MVTKHSDLLKGSLLTEFRTVSAMMTIYCRDHHSGPVLCNECQALLDYAETKLDRCPYGQAKPTCNQCPIHCYKPAQKEQMRLVMRYAGQRMLLPHPLLALRHLIHERKADPGKPLPNSSNRHHRQLKNK